MAGRIARVATTLGVAMLVASCASAQKSVGGWFGAETPTPAPSPAARKAASARGVYYAAVGDVKVYGEPSASSKVVGTLSLHEKVTRSRLERGYAYVESTKSGVKGWVDNAQLTWRAPAVPGGAEEEPEEEREVPATPEATPTAAEPEPVMTPVPTAPAASLPTPRPVGPSIFNPY